MNSLKPAARCVFKKKLSSARSTLEIEDAQVGAQIPVRLGLKALCSEVARGAPATALGVLGLVLAHRRGLVGQVGQMRHEVGKLGLELGAAIGQTVDLLVDLAHGFLGRLGLVALAHAHERTDLLGLGVARGLQLLDLGDHGATLIVQSKELLTIPRRLAVGHCGIDDVRVLANEFDVKHDASTWKCASCAHTMCGSGWRHDCAQASIYL